MKASLSIFEKNIENQKSCKKRAFVTICWRPEKTVDVRICKDTVGNAKSWYH